MKVNINLLRPNNYTNELYGEFSLSNEEDYLLFQTIRLLGLVEPLIISNDYVIISGVRRFKVAKMLGITEVPVIIKNTKEVNEIDVIIHNQFRNKNPIQWAYEYEKIREQLGSKQGKKLEEEDKNKLDAVKQVVLKNISDTSRKRVLTAFKISKELTPEKNDKQIWKDLSEEFKKRKNVNSILSNLEVLKSKKKNDEIRGIYESINEDCFKIIQGDSSNVSDEIEDDSIQCLMTSPPYWNYRKYDQNTNDNLQIPLGNEVNVDDYINSLVEIFSKYKNKLKLTSSIFVNVMDKVHNGKIMNIPYKVSLKMEENGFQHMQTIMWYKRNPQYSSNHKIAQPICEYILHFTLDTEKYSWNKYWMSELDNREFLYDVLYGKEGEVPLLKNIIIPFSDELSNFEFSLPPLFKPEVLNKHSLNKMLEDKGFVLTHDALFSYEIPMLFILPTTRRKDICLDIFSGLGTTGIVAYATDRSYIGVENSKLYASQSKARFIELFKEKFKEQILI